MMAQELPKQFGRMLGKIFITFNVKKYLFNLIALATVSKIGQRVSRSEN